MARKTVNIILIFLIFPLIIFSSILTNYSLSDYFGFNSANSELLDTLKVTTLSIATILGIICGFVYQNIGTIKGDDNSENSGFFKKLLRNSELWKSLLASPIICGVVLATNRNSPDLLMAIIFAFENGFFSNLVFSFEKKE